LKIRPYGIVLLCDFQPGLLSRVLDVYRFFHSPPEIILARRKNDRLRVWTDHRLSVRVEAIPLPVIGLQNVGILGALWAAFSSLGYLIASFVLYMKTTLAKPSPRLVHAHFIFPEGLFGLILARLLRVPLIVTAAGGDVNFMMKKNAILRTLSLFVLRRACVTIAVSKPLQAKLHRFGVQNCIHIPNSVDTCSIRPIEGSVDGNSVLFVGALNRGKQPLLLLQAFEQVVKQVSSATLLLCGDGPLRQSLQEETLKRGLQDRVKLVPRVNQERLNDLRATAGVFVLPSLSEGLSLALLEALAAGIPVVASRNDSHVAILEHGQNALLFDPCDSADLARQILLLMTRVTVRERIGRAGRLLCQSRFSNEVVARQLESLYLEAMCKPALA
jgi:glycosyltransferase involved in cell wall biosynthesis